MPKVRRNKSAVVVYLRNCVHCMGIDACVEFRSRNAESTLNVSASAGSVGSTAWNTGGRVFVVVESNDPTARTTASCVSVGASSTTVRSIRPLHCVLVGRFEVYVLYVVSVESLHSKLYFVWVFEGVPLDKLELEDFLFVRNAHLFVGECGL